MRARRVWGQVQREGQPRLGVLVPPGPRELPRPQTRGTLVTAVDIMHARVVAQAHKSQVTSHTCTVVHTVPFRVWQRARLRRRLSFSVSVCRPWAFPNGCTPLMHLWTNLICACALPLGLCSGRAAKCLSTSSMSSSASLPVQRAGTTMMPEGAVDNSGRVQDRIHPHLQYVQDTVVARWWTAFLVLKAIQFYLLTSLKKH